jgi:hypothetical protein
MRKGAICVAFIYTFYIFIYHLMAIQTHFSLQPPFYTVLRSTFYTALPPRSRLAAHSPRSLPRRTDVWLPQSPVSLPRETSTGPHAHHTPDSLGETSHDLQLSGWLARLAGVKSSQPSDARPSPRLPCPLASAWRSWSEQHPVDEQGPYSTIAPDRQSEAIVERSRSPHQPKETALKHPPGKA